MTTNAVSTPPTGFSRFVRDSAIYSIGTAVGKAAALLTLPIVTRALQPNAYGELEVISTLMSAVTSLLILGLDVAVTRVYPTFDEAQRRRMFATWIVISMAVTVPAAAAMTFARGPLSDLFFGYQNLAEEIALAGAFVVVTSLQLISLTILRNQGRAGRFAMITGGTLVANAFLVVLFLQREEAVRSILLANVVSQSLGAVAGLWMTRRSFVARPSVALGDRITRLGVPLVPAAAALFGGEVLLRTILFNMSSDIEAGYYGLGVRFASIVILVVMGLQTAWHPRAFAALDHADGLGSIADDGRRILALISVAAVGVALVAPSAVVIVGGDAYAGAGAAVAWLLLWALVFGVYQIVTMPSAIAERMGDIGLSGAVGMGIAVALTLVLAEPHGAAGTAAALAFGQAVAVAVAIVLGRRRITVPFPLRSMVVVSLAAVVSILATTVETGLAVRLALGLVFTAIVAVDGSLNGAAGLLQRSRRG